MKKIVTVSIVFLLLSAAAFAQRDESNRDRKDFPKSFDKGRVTRGERSELRKDAVRYKAAKHHARKDGKISAGERKRLHKMRKHNRHDAFRFKHNRHHRHHSVK